MGELSFVSPMHSLCWRKCRDPAPPSRHHCGLSAAKMEKHVPYRLFSASTVPPRTIPCAVITLLQGLGWGRVVGLFFKGTYCSHFNLRLRALVRVNICGLSILCVSAYSSTPSGRGGQNVLTISCC
ncbi:unnamed protein product [Pipistrellus nathusii]|uniref:Uncharacterized protein n=1 Tax=Pipistrellus nathusii TaxID=59473 RepID=A0ABN9ZDH7_PIPNA